METVLFKFKLKDSTRTSFSLKILDHLSSGITHCYSLLLTSNYTRPQVIVK